MILALLDPIIVDTAARPQVMQYTLSKEIKTILSEIEPQLNISYMELTLEQVISSKDYQCKHFDYLGFIPAIIYKRHCLLVHWFNRVPNNDSFHQLILQKIAANKGTLEATIQGMWEDIDHQFQSDLPLIPEYQP